MFLESGNRRYCRPELPQLAKPLRLTGPFGTQTLLLPRKLPYQLVSLIGKALLDPLQAAVSTPSTFKVDLECQYDLSQTHLCARVEIRQLSQD
jgi:hypothetical protein